MSDMTPEVRRIHELVGALSDAFWHEMNPRDGEVGFSAITSLLEHNEKCRPETPEEASIWDELTSPRNYEALVAYGGYWKPVGINDYATRLHAALIAEARDRRSLEDA